MTVRRIGTWKDVLRRHADALGALSLPGGLRLYRTLAAVDGYLYPHEAVFLYWLARSGPGSGAIVEIGSFRGRSTLCFWHGARRRAETAIFAVDPHVYRTEQDLRENLAHFGAAERVTVVVAPSVETAQGWRDPVRALFLDGNHEEPSVDADLRAWLPHVAPGGFVLFHDSTDLSGFPGPIAVARKHLRVASEFDAVGRVGSITWARRSGGSSWLPPQHGAKAMDALLRRIKRIPTTDAKDRR